VRQVLDAIRWVLEGISQAGESDALDHIWIHIDQAESSSNGPTIVWRLAGAGIEEAVDAAILV
jgi:hypothetical protein